MKHPLPFVGPVDRRRLILLRIDAGQCGNVQDGAKAHFLPYARGNEDRPEVLRSGQEVDFVKTKLVEDQVEQPVCGGKKVGDQPRDNHDGYEMGQIGKGLYNPLEQAMLDLIEQQCQRDGCRKRKKQTVKADDKGIFQKPPKIRICKQFPKMFKTDPFAARNPLKKLVILKGNLHSVHGHVFKKHVPCKERNEQQIQEAVLDQRLHDDHCRTLPSDGVTGG